MKKVYIKDYALHIPSRRMSFEEISKLANLPADVVREKQGIVSKPIETKLSTSEMCVECLKSLALKNKAESKKAEFLIYAGSDFKDHYVWTIATKICSEALHRNILAFDITSQCVGSLVAMDFAKSKLLTSKRGDASAFVTLATKQSKLVDLKNPAMSFLDDFSDGAVSILLTNRTGRYEVLESSFISDGRFSEIIYAPFGDRHSESREKWDFRAILDDRGNWRKEMEKVSGKNFIHVIRDSVAKSGYSLKDVSYLAMLHVKRSFHHKILDELGIDQEKSIYLENYGHMQGVDPLLSLKLGEEAGKIHKGDLVVMVAAGTGWTWGATTLLAKQNIRN
jgi:3-oxoacyl-[acyl-carrier-protein] synthase III